ncbi:hypothetical protein [Lysinibacillus sp. 54212]|uniref:hypothetical protein n=1 Tax=Lysinibacillus sp. 54212 TaxID=3119829 RepID=UPI002FC9C79B
MFEAKAASVAVGIRLSLQSKASYGKSEIVETPQEFTTRRLDLARGKRPPKRRTTATTWIKKFWGDTLYSDYKIKYAVYFLDPQK